MGAPPNDAAVHRRPSTYNNGKQSAVPDVADVECPAGPPGVCHDVRAGKPGPGRYAEQPVWRCWICSAPWTELDAQIRRASL